MKILIITASDRSLGLAHRLVLEGHEVQIYVPEGSPGFVCPKTGEDLYKFIANPKEGIKEAKFIVCDTNIPAGLYNFAKMFNKPVVGSTPLATSVNSDVTKEFEVVIKADCSYPYTQLFEDAIDVSDLVINWDNDSYYIKYDRRVVNCDHSDWLAWSMYNLPLYKRVLVQERIDGVEASVSGWFDGINWRKPFLICNTDSEKLGASILWRDGKGLASKFTIEPLKDFLKLIGYHGPVKCNILVTSTITYLTKIKLGIHYPDIYAFMEGLREPVGDFLWSIAIGRTSDISYTKDIASAFEVGVRESDMDGAPLTGVEDENLRHVVLHNVFRSEDSYFLANGFSRVYTAAARGDVVDQATGRIYRTIQLLTFPCMGYPSNMRFHMNMLYDRVNGLLDQQVA